jgi:hypothetical protein
MVAIERIGSQVQVCGCACRILEVLLEHNVSQHHRLDSHRLKTHILLWTIVKSEVQVTCKVQIRT